jgi:hypothetical protein
MSLPSCLCPLSSISHLELVRAQNSLSVRTSVVPAPILQGVLLVQVELVIHSVEHSVHILGVALSHIHS